MRGFFVSSAELAVRLTRKNERREVRKWMDVAFDELFGAEELRAGGEKSWRL